MESSPIERPYAKAVFQYASSRDTLDEWSKILGLLSYIVSDPKINKEIKLSSKTKDEKARLLCDLAIDDITRPVKNFILDLSRMDRLLYIPAIYCRFEHLRLALGNVKNVTVCSAYELSTLETSSIKERLVNRFQAQIELSTVIDKSIIGGMIITAGDLVIDHSLRGRLNQLKDSLT